VTGSWRARPTATAERRSVLWMLAAGAASALAGCTEPRDPPPRPRAAEPLDGVGPIVFAAPPDLSLGGQRRRAVERWSERHPGQRAEFVELPNQADLQRAELLTKLQAESRDYDVLGLDVVWTAEFARDGHILPLTSVADALRVGQFLPAALESGRFEGELWAVPLHSNAGLLYFNTDLVPSPPRSWDELAAQAKSAVERHGVDGYVAQFARYEGLTVNFAEAVWGHGGALVEGDRVTAASPAAVSALDRLARGVQEEGWIPKAALSYTEEESRERFQSGEAAFMRNWPYAYELLEADDSPVKDKFQAVRLTGVSALGGLNLAISRHSQRRQTALDFIRFLTTDDAQTTTFEEGGYPAAVASVYDDRGVQYRQHYTAELLESIRTARSRPVSPYYGQVTRLIQDAAYSALRGIRSAADAMEQLAKDLELALEGG
jgi:multiple sugar transport system substrate-binding protein